MTPGLRRLATEAAGVGVSFETAAAVVIERALVTRERALDESELAELERRAGAVRPRAELSAASAAYLRELGKAAGEAVVFRERTAVIALPARLNDRIRSPRAVLDLVDPATLTGALAWESAAVVSGWTLTEWALVQLLELRV